MAEDVSTADDPSALSPEQQAIRDAGQLASSLIQKQTDWAALLASMVAFRQGYFLVCQELAQRCQQLAREAEQKNESLPLLEDFLLQLAAYQASIPFSEQDWLQSLLQHVLPWVIDLVDRHAQEEEEVRQQEALEAEAFRRSLPVPIGWCHSVGSPPSLLRDQSLVLVGPKAALRRVLEQTASHVLTQRGDRGHLFSILWLTNEDQPPPSQRQLVRIPRSRWVRLANSRSRMEEALDRWVQEKLSALPDLLLVDDLSLAYDSGFSWRPKAAEAGDAHRRLKSWCQKTGCALLGAIPEENVDAIGNGPEYEALRTFTLLRPVLLTDVENDPEHQRLIVGPAAAFLIRRVSETSSVPADGENEREDLCRVSHQSGPSCGQSDA